MVIFYSDSLLSYAHLVKLHDFINIHSTSYPDSRNLWFEEVVLDIGLSLLTILFKLTFYHSWFAVDLSCSKSSHSATNSLWLLSSKKLPKINVEFTMRIFFPKEWLSVFGSVFLDLVMPCSLPYKFSTLVKWQYCTTELEREKYWLIHVVWN